ncbi:hypothetical protein CRG98_020384 [Punica granatum]|uniref:Uncharacterized protein n=1 Tax=Punica granatum TaxID=22663 RepID=A0A2I0JSI6_PUNGR|nr:hypothetical protein CRG98_020384 [Punica granatum]
MAMDTHRHKEKERERERERESWARGAEVKVRERRRDSGECVGRGLSEKGERQRGYVPEEDDHRHRVKPLEAHQTGGGEGDETEVDGNLNNYGIANQESGNQDRSKLEVGQVRFIKQERGTALAGGMKP